MHNHLLPFRPLHVCTRISLTKLAALFVSHNPSSASSPSHQVLRKRFTHLDCRTVSLGTPTSAIIRLMLRKNRRLAARSIQALNRSSHCGQISCSSPSL